MKTKAHIVAITSFALLTCSVKDDPCKVNHVIINGECVPDYIFPSAGILQNGDRFFHDQLGVITFIDGQWENEQGYIIEELELKTGK